MTDRVSTITVFLTTDIRIDDIAPMIEAFRLFRGVSDAQPDIADPGEFLAERRARDRILAQMHDILWQTPSQPWMKETT